jgi:hypothetical protein
MGVEAWLKTFLLNDKLKTIYKYDSAQMSW